MAWRFRHSSAVCLAPPAGAPVRVLVADHFAGRLLGLAFLGELPLDGLLITRCASIHTFGMRFALDVVFLDGRSLKVLGVEANLRAWRGGKHSDRRAGVRRRDLAALELLPGRAAALGLRPGARLRPIEPACFG